MSDLTLTTRAVDSVAPIATGDLVDGDGTVTLPGVDACERLLLLVANLDAATDATVTLLAGTDPPAWEAAAGDLAFTVNGTGGAFPAVVLGPLSSSRFVRSDGSIQLSVALGGGDGVTITAYELARL